MPGWQEFVIDPLTVGLTGLADAVGGFGVAIVLMTLAIRVLIFPLSVRGIRAQRKIQVLQPKVNEIKMRARGDRQKESQLTMALYKEYGVSPLSGCLPLLLQMPVLLAMYGALLTVGTCIGADGVRIEQGIMGLGADTYANCAALGGTVPLDQDFLWFNLAQIDRTIEFLFLPQWWPAPLTYISVLALLGGLTFWLQTFMAQPVQAPTGPQATFQRVMQIYPLFFVFIGWFFFSGILLYWVLAGFIQIAQQFFISGLGKLEPMLSPDHQELAQRLGAGYFAGSQPPPPQATSLPKETEQPDSPTLGAKTANTRKRRRRRRRRRG